MLEGFKKDSNKDNRSTDKLEKYFFVPTNNFLLIIKDLLLPTNNFPPKIGKYLYNQLSIIYFHREIIYW